MYASIDLIELDISSRTLNVLRREGHREVRDLYGLTAVDLLPLPFFGVACLADLRQGLEPHGVVIHDDDNPLTIRQVCEWVDGGGRSVAAMTADLDASHEHVIEALKIYIEGRGREYLAGREAR